MKRKLSVVVPCRDAEPWVSELLESLIDQGIPDCEILVVDNGSTDASQQIVEAYARADARVRLLRSDASSAGAARNDGIAAASGEYLVFADADDLVPDGAYLAMLDSLEESGSDMAIGDHLKFAPAATWSPTQRWHSFESDRVAVAPDDAPALLTGRACWNRMFRRSFWDGRGLRFPDLSSLEDIEPMTRAFVDSTSIDVVRKVVYLYRDRSDGSSISQNADAAATVRYLEQEYACARLLTDRPALLQQYVQMILDADGWSHLARFLAADPSAAEVASVESALAELARAVPLDGGDGVAPTRRLLWDLVLMGKWTDAKRFVLGVDGPEAERRLAAWRNALVVLREGGLPTGRLGRLVDPGLISTLVNDADAVSLEWLADALPDLQTLPLEGSGAGLRSAMADAVRRCDAPSVVAVSALRNIVPLVIASATPTQRGLELSGPRHAGQTTPEVELVLRSGSVEETIPVHSVEGSWSARIDADRLPVGRWTVHVHATGIDEEFPVITARMPLPPVGDPFLLQPLADRNDGWRFLVDKRPLSRTGVGSIFSRIGRKLR